jgi:hypothetical protein
VGAIVAASIVAAFYLLFVIHYSVNAIFWDEWSLVPLIHAALHSHLTFGALWVQHNESRVLVPNLLIVGSALAHSYNSKTIILLGALLFVASYVLFLAAVRIYLDRPLSAIHALSFGVVWFSLEDTENSLWGFQLDWYLTVFFLLVLVCLMAKERKHRNIVFTLAALAAVTASFSSLQGLILWPIGLMYLLWRRPQMRRDLWECGIWLVLGAGTTATYFWGFDFQKTGGGGSAGSALHHPVTMVKFVLVELGNVVPTTSQTLGTHELIGSVLLLASVFVVVICVRERTSPGRRPLPVALVMFGLLFDGSTALGRLGFGVVDAKSTRYTMANLLVLVGILSFAWAHLNSGPDASAPVVRLRSARLVGIVPLAGFLVLQLVTATQFGFTTARTTRTDRVFDAQTVVNLDSIPSPEAQQLVSSFVYPNLAALRPLLRQAEADHIGDFAPGPYRFYRSKGPP